MLLSKLLQLELHSSHAVVKQLLMLLTIGFQHLQLRAKPSSIILQLGHYELIILGTLLNQLPDLVVCVIGLVREQREVLG
jgi:hypothetical protein